MADRELRRFSTAPEPSGLGKHAGGQSFSSRRRPARPTERFKRPLTRVVGAAIRSLRVRVWRFWWRPFSSASSVSRGTSRTSRFVPSAQTFKRGRPSFSSRPTGFTDRSGDGRAHSCATRRRHLARRRFGIAHEKRVLLPVTVPETTGYL
eukprot:scaffold3469_cov246-Pinguiococcus_pyrenoidosus.AAC.8